MSEKEIISKYKKYKDLRKEELAEKEEIEKKKDEFLLEISNLVFVLFKDQLKKFTAEGSFITFSLPNRLIKVFISEDSVSVESYRLPISEEGLKIVNEMVLIHYQCETLYEDAVSEYDWKKEYFDDHNFEDVKKCLEQFV